MVAPAQQSALPRYVTPDSRNSLRQHLFGARPNGLAGVVRKVAKPELVPLFACVGGAIAMGSWFAQRHLFRSPNVHVSKTTRKMTIPPPAQHNEVARRFTRHRESMRGLAHVIERPPTM